MNNNDMLFFCRTYDFLHVFIPKEKSGSHHTAVTYRQGLKTFRNYVNNIAGIPANRFEFRDCTYDFLLDYRNHLHEVDNLKTKTVNNKPATVKSYMSYASARDLSLQQYAFFMEQVPYYSEPKELQPVIEDADALAALLHMSPNTRKGLRDKVIMSVLYDSGMRVDEPVSMDVRNVCPDHNDVKLRLHGKGNKECCVVMDSKTMALIRQYMGGFHPERNMDAPFIYTVTDGKQKYMTARNVQKLIKKYSDKVREEYDLPESYAAVFLESSSTNRLQL